jgi:DNA-binding Lrp family transcriptional regulator
MTLSPEDRRRLAQDGRKQREWTDRRNADIRAAHDAGASLREIADAVGLSHMAVSAIIKKDAR